MIFICSLRYPNLISAEKVKRDLDSSFGAPWHVVVGESYDFNIDFDFHYLYYLLYGPVAILAWRVTLGFDL